MDRTANIINIKYADVTGVLHKMFAIHGYLQCHQGDEENCEKISLYPQESFESTGMVMVYRLPFPRADLIFIFPSRKLTLE